VRVKFLARIQGDDFGNREVVLVPSGRRYDLRMRPRPPLRALVAVTLPGLQTPNPGSIQAWLDAEARQTRVDELRPHLFAPATLADFMDAVNAETFLDAVTEWNTDALVAFAKHGGAELLAAVRAELDGAMQPAKIFARARRYARITGLPDAPAILDELEQQHEVERLLGLEHALIRWIGNTDALRDLGIAALARRLPEADVSAGISDEWFGWWWRFARAVTRSDLEAAVVRVLDHVDRECELDRRSPVATDTRAFARESLEDLRRARHASLWTPPYDSRTVVKTIVRDRTDAHYAAFMAVSHAAHALAHAINSRDANRRATRALAQLALAAITSRA
jgi:hypothetical protein